MSIENNIWRVEWHNQIWPWVTLTDHSPDYLAIEWEGICRLQLHLVYYYDSLNVI